VASRPRTITVRVRTLLAAAAVVLTGTLVWWGLGYPTGMQPLSTGTGTTALHGLRVAAKTPLPSGRGRRPPPGIRAGHTSSRFRSTTARPWALTRTASSVDLRFTTLGVFHDTQAVPLGDMKPVMTVPRSSC
jgi:hypothetical protein